MEVYVDEMLVKSPQAKNHVENMEATFHVLSIEWNWIPLNVHLVLSLESSLDTW